MEPSAGNDETRARDKIGDFVFLVVVLLFFCGVIFGAIYGCSIGGVIRRARRTPGFSAMVTDTGSLDPLRSPVIHPVFGLTLRVDNYMYLRMCRENATVTVSYGGVILGWGGLEELCVDKRASTEVMVALSHADVMLTDELRRNMMASELRAGELEVLVELRMLFPKGYECDNCAPQILQYCRVRPGQGYSPCHCHALKPY